MENFGIVIILCVIYLLWIFLPSKERTIKKYNAFIDRAIFCEVSKATVFFMLAAYLYAYANGSFLFDGGLLNRGEEPLNVAAGKWAVWLVAKLDAHFSSPWFAGMLTILFMIFSIYFLVDFLRIQKKWAIWIFAGLCSTQSAIICSNEYTGGYYMFISALMFACLSAWILNKPMNAVLRIGISMFSLAICTAIYGAYSSVTSCVMIIFIIMQILSGESAKNTWKKAVSYLLTFFGGMSLYYVILRILLYQTKQPMQAYMGEAVLEKTSGMFTMFQYIPESYKVLFEYYIGKQDYLPVILEQCLLLIMITGILLTGYFIAINYKKVVNYGWNTLLLIFAILVFPLSINFIYVCSCGNIHYLMIFSYVFPLLLFVKEWDMLLLQEKEYNQVIRRSGILVNILLCLFIYGSILLSNAVMVRLHNQYEVSMSIATRLLDRIESCEGYIGNENVMLIGALYYNEYFENKESNEIFSANVGPASNWHKNGLEWGAYLTNFLNYNLRTNLHFDVYDTYEALWGDNLVDGETKTIIENANAFPAENSVWKQGDTIYVVLSTKEMW